MQARKVGVNRWMLVMERGEELVAVLTSFLTEKKIHGGFLTGIGSVRNISLGYFDCEVKDYAKRTFDEVMELGNLTGSIGTVDGKPFAHLHAIVCGPELIAFTGHLFSAEVAVTAEIVVSDFGVDLPREIDDEAGLKIFNIGAGAPKDAGEEPKK